MSAVGLASDLQCDDRFGGLRRDRFNPVRGWTGIFGDPQGEDLGPVYAHVKFKLSGNVCDPSYRPKDLMQHSWTPERLYQVAGQPTSEQLAARFNGSIVVYRAMAPVS